MAFHHHISVERDDEVGRRAPIRLVGLWEHVQVYAVWERCTISNPYPTKSTKQNCGGGSDLHLGFAAAEMFRSRSTHSLFGSRTMNGQTFRKFWWIKTRFGDFSSNVLRWPGNFYQSRVL
ncbi:unnamed protein product [Linum tenue]|uniref:Uncharacterized protein n=1 Tax=Linum tenue TaxID=586396 RepID=A0AAV0HN74_9ROSI|nr:unnamed protein product [Linum tenue]